MNLSKDELVLVQGGALSASMLNAISRVVTTIFNIGRAVGSAIYRIMYRKIC